MIGKPRWAGWIALGSFLALGLTNSCGPLSGADHSLGEGAASDTVFKQKVVHFPLPKTLEFAGEQVPLEDEEVAERLERELTANSYLHGSTLLILRRESRWKPMILERLKAHGIPEDFFYLAVAESNLSNTAVSVSQAVGMWQLLEPTAEELGLQVGNKIDQRMDPFLATEAACLYLKQSFEKFGNWTLVAAAFNRGKTGIAEALAAQKVENYYDLYLNEESYRYLFRILAMKLILQSPESYGFRILPQDRYQPWKIRTITIDSSQPHLPDFAHLQGVTYKTLKQYNPWLGIGSYELPVPKGKTFQVYLPEE